MVARKSSPYYCGQYIYIYIYIYKKNAKYKKMPEKQM